MVTALAAIIAAKLLPGINIAGGYTIIVLALVLALLNGFVKPVLIILTIPISILTLGLFLLVINVLIIKWTSDIVKGFHVANWWSALLFSILLSIVTWLIESLIAGLDSRNREE